MENSSSQDDREMPSFFCHLCSISCASALNLQSHFLGIKHRKVEEAIRIHVTDKGKEKKEGEMVPTDKNPNITLLEHINACKDSEPALGLEYVYQYRRLGYYTYECKLCECRAGLTHMFMHVVGAKHRITYLGKHHPELGICGPYIMRGPKKLKRLRDICLKVEQEFGRKNINVMDGIDSQWGCNPDAAVSSVNFTPYTKVEKVDFTNDDYFAAGDKPAVATEDDKQVVTDPVVTFLELKAAYEASLKDASSDNIEHNIEHNSAAEETLVFVTEEDTEDTEETEQKEDTEHIKDTEHKEDTVKESENDSPEKEEHNKEPCKSDQGFRSSKEVFSFLEHFSIVEEEDTKFVNTVVEMLTSALLRHRKGCKEKKLSTSDATSEQDKCKEQVPASSNQDLEYQFKTPLFPVPKAAEKKKRKFTDSPYTDQEYQYKTPHFPVPKAAEKKKWKFTDSPYTDQEYQYKTPHFPVPKAAEKKKWKFTDSPYTDQDTPGTQSQRPAAYQHDNRLPTSQPQASSSLVSGYRVQQYYSISATQVNMGAPVAQTRFAPPQAPFPQTRFAPPQAPFPQTRFAPPQAPFPQTRFAPPQAPSRPPLFPIAKDDVVSKFFDSIKNMDVNEVASTLNRITATNPAFKGINVPSLVRYLTETGKLRTTQSMQQTYQ